MSDTGVVDAERLEAQERRISAMVVVALLEVLRAQDFPQEILEEENLTATLPRRLGLNEVVDAQIRRYRKEARRRRRVRAGELRDLIQLVLRRPDSRDIFYGAGRRLAGGGGRGWRLVRALPQAALLAVARRRACRRVEWLLGGPALVAEGGSFRLVGRELITARSDSSGTACALLSGLFDGLLERYTGRPAQVVHDECAALGHPWCVWTLSSHRAAGWSGGSRRPTGVG